MTASPLKTPPAGTKAARPRLRVKLQGRQPKAPDPIWLPRAQLNDRKRVPNPMCLSRGNWVFAPWPGNPWTIYHVEDQKHDFDFERCATVGGLIALVREAASKPWVSKADLLVLIKMLDDLLHLDLSYASPDRGGKVDVRAIVMRDYLDGKSPRPSD